ncbi:MAG: SpoIIE family protein phosphatase, partial [Anaerovoracaceae bacterium]
EKDDLWLGEYFKKAIQRANGDILELSKEKKENRGMATTFLMCYLVEDKAYFINVGDSRAYLFRENELFQLTEDHTYVNSLVKLGVITQEEAKDHKKGHVITRALGAEKFINADFYQTNLVEGDVLLLCTDGLYGEVPEEELCKMIIKEKNMSKLAKLLVNEANELGGRDNITVVCLKVAGGNKDE